LKIVSTVRGPRWGLCYEVGLERGEPRLGKAHIIRAKRMAEAMSPLISPDCAVFASVSSELDVKHGSVPSILATS
jgi:hypothetical protein